MNTAMINWKTSLGGVVLIGAAALHTFLGVNIPGFNMDLGSAIAAGLALFTAQDAAPTPPAA